MWQMATANASAASAGSALQPVPRAGHHKLHLFLLPARSHHAGLDLERRVLGHRQPLGSAASNATPLTCPVSTPTWHSPNRTPPRWPPHPAASVPTRRTTRGNLFQPHRQVLVLDRRMAPIAFNTSRGCRAVSQDSTTPYPSLPCRNRCEDPHWPECNSPALIPAR